jgi:hypothetical protein
MERRKQSPIDRARRLEQGQCPIHGLRLRQVGDWHREEGGMFAGMECVLVECPRQDCRVRAKAYSLQNGPWELLPEWGYLLEQVL